MALAALHCSIVCSGISAAVRAVMTAMRHFYFAVIASDGMAQGKERKHAGAEKQKDRFLHKIEAQRQNFTITPTWAEESYYSTNRAHLLRAKTPDRAMVYGIFTKMQRKSPACRAKRYIIGLPSPIFQ